ncbi:orotidine-5'-phosphate decarboxylase [Lacticaseibacillus zhaodongensis]|uniref:orotidine-5'-phosphate decarboxylase n=1 Tax=Lacticaseibacillus zhaodongensis TaxID=2668065 RepID=UPI0012D2A9AF|nr:orotidine-5'-phosphate decarboxylase [Lacticaseibacillus zhaodongensis]
MRIDEPIIALDFPSQENVTDFLDRFPVSEELYVKVGMELYYAAGPDIVRLLKSRGLRVFLDLKLHDIPHTVEAAARVIASLGADMCTVHAAGGSDMLKAARSGLDAGSRGTTPLMLAITQLTSTSQEQLNTELQVPGSMRDSVLGLARMAKGAGADGVVCSALEAGDVAAKVGTDFLRVTPGIRPAGAATGDQARVVTPQRAGQIGSSAIVVGRPITQADNPYSAYTAIKTAWNEGEQND